MKPLNRSKDFRSIIGAVSAFTGCLLLLSACELTAQQEASLESLLAGPSPSPSPAVVNDTTSASGRQCTSEQFTQPSAPKLNSVDLLFVLDTSGSMENEITAVVNGLDAFVAKLPVGVDYRIGVMPAHGSQSKWTGRVWGTRSHPSVLDSNTMNITRMRSDLHYLLSNAPDDVYPDEGEEGLYSFRYSLDPVRMAANQANGFYRESAAWAVVFISDENDICATFPTSDKTRDSVQNELRMKHRDCGGITPASVLAALKSVRGDKPFALGGIVNTTHSKDKAYGEEEYGYGYMDLLGLTSGVPIDINQMDFRDGLAQIGAVTTTQLTLVSDFVLAKTGIDMSTIEVTVDGKQTTFTFDPITGVLHLPQPGTALSQVSINYCMPVPTPTPTPTPTSTPDPTPTPSTSPSPSPTPSPTDTTTPPCEGPSCGNGGVLGV